MKAIMMSIRPEWVAKILNGEKTTEIRKHFPSDFVGWVYIYVTRNKPYLYHEKTNIGSYDFYELTPDGVQDLPNYKHAYTVGHNLNGKVVARFWCDKVEKYFGGAYVIQYSLNYSFEDLRKDVLENADEEDKEIDLKELEWYEQLLKDTQLTREELKKYVGYKDFSAIHITNLEIFDDPKELKNFLIYSHTISGIGFKGEEKTFKVLKPLTKAPESWQYIEVDEC